MNEISGEVNHTCEASPTSAASNAAAYFAICARMASAAFSRGALQAAASSNAKSGRRMQALLGFFTMDLLGYAELMEARMSVWSKPVSAETNVLRNMIAQSRRRRTHREVRVTFHFP